MGRTLKYRKYLNSPEWKARAAVVKSFAKYRCQLCGHKVPPELLDTHHNNYKHLGKEEQTDLICLCRYCHGLFEFNKKHGEEFRAAVQELAEQYDRACASLADVDEYLRGTVYEARDFLAMVWERIEMIQAAVGFFQDGQDDMQERRAA